MPDASFYGPPALSRPLRHATGILARREVGSIGETCLVFDPLLPRYASLSWAMLTRTISCGKHRGVELSPGCWYTAGKWRCGPGHGAGPGQADAGPSRIGRSAGTWCAVPQQCRPCQPSCLRQGKSGCSRLPVAKLPLHPWHKTHDTMRGCGGTAARTPSAQAADERRCSSASPRTLTKHQP